MKKTLIFIFLMFSAQTLLAQGVVFETGTWSEVTAKAKRDNKPIFVDFYTSWCAPCKVIATTVFPDAKLGRIYNDKFVNYKIDAEKGEGVELAKKYGVAAYPTFVYLDSNGELINKIVGAKGIKEFIAEVDNIDLFIKFGGMKKMNEEYAAGRNDSEFLLNYHQLTDEERKNEVYNKYLLSLPDDELFDVNKKIIEGIVIFDAKLFNRLADGILSMNNEYRTNDSYVFNVRFETLYHLSKFLLKSIETNDRQMLNDVMAIKEKLSVIENALDGDMYLIEGRGLFFASNDFVNLIDIHKNGSIEDFKVTFVKFTENEMANINADTVCNSLKTTVASLNNKSLMQIYNGQYMMMNQFYVNKMASYLDLYWKNSPSDKKTISNCTKIALFLFKINPYDPKSALQLSPLLVRFGKKKEAIEIVKYGIECRRQFKDEKGVTELENHLRYIENNKI